jgi:hypothetical protein
VPLLKDVNPDATEWIDVKVRWHLSVTQGEYDAASMRA